MNIREAVKTVDEIERRAKRLELIDWEEVLDFVPDSDELKEEVKEHIRLILYYSQELNNFFE